MVLTHTHTLVIPTLFSLCTWRGMDTEMETQNSIFLLPRLGNSWSVRQIAEGKELSDLWLLNRIQKPRLTSIIDKVVFFLSSYTNCALLTPIYHMDMPQKWIHGGLWVERYQWYIYYPSVTTYVYLTASILNMVFEWGIQNPANTSFVQINSSMYCQKGAPRKLVIGLSVAELIQVYHNYRDNKEGCCFSLEV